MTKSLLSGVRLIAVEQYGAAPFGSQILAALGADVIKIENSATGGDVSRSIGPHRIGNSDSEFFQTFNRNKRSLTLNLKSPSARSVLDRLVKSADGLFNNLRGDHPEKLGLTFDSLKQINPKIVCAHLSAYGRTGSRTNLPGYDYLMQAEAGYMYLTGDPEGPPTRFGLSMIDYSTGLTMALSLVSGILGARASGKGADLDVSLFDVAFHQLTYPAMWYLNHGELTERLPRSSHPSITPSQVFATADGWIFVMCQLPKFWEEFARSIGRADLLTDPRFAEPDPRRENRQDLQKEIDKALKSATTQEWMDRLSGKVPSAPILSLDEALESGYSKESGMIENYMHPEVGNIRTIACPIKVDGVRPASVAAPKMGANTTEILQELGFSANEIATLKNEGAV